MGTAIYSSIASDKNDKYEYKQGTSMASPYIAGVVANLLYVHPNLSYAEVRHVLFMNGKTVDDCIDCVRAQYVCESPIVYDLPHQLTVMEIAFIVVGSVVVFCLLVCIVGWAVVCWR